MQDRWYPKEVVAHSMGNRALTLVFDRLNQSNFGLEKRKFLCSAADVKQEDFIDRVQGIRNRNGEQCICTLHCAKNDRAMWLSRRLNNGRRAGDCHRAIYCLSPDHFNTVDCTYPWPRAVDPHCHAYLWRPNLSQEVRLVLASERLMTPNRDTRPTVEQVQDQRYWKIRWGQVAT